MKYSILFSILILAYSCTQPVATKPQVAETKMAQTPIDIKWQDVSQARALAKQTGKDILFFVYAPWCSKCEAYRSTVFSDPEVISKINANFIAVQFNAQESKTVEWEGKQYSNPDYDHSKAFDDVNTYHELVYHVGAESIPSILIMDNSLGILQSILGLKDKKTFMFLVGNATGRW